MAKISTEDVKNPKVRKLQKLSKFSPFQSFSIPSDISPITFCSLFISLLTPVLRLVERF